VTISLVPDAVDAYAEAHTTAPPEFLARLAEETRASLDCPQMLTGAIEGRFLQTLVFLGQPQLVLELGTYSGYSALAMAAALPPGGRIVTCEISQEHAEFAQRHIDASPYADRIEIRLAPALDTIASLAGPFDFVFIDADKPSYRDYYEAVLAKLGPRGLIAVDNTLWSGRVVEPGDDAEESTRALAAFNDYVAADERVISVMLTIRDGVTLIRRA
jgi:predicted O-methyltransferase YrrM